MMSLDWMSVARPYAKAVFDIAVEHKELAQWSLNLGRLALCLQDPNVQFFVRRPDVTNEQKVDALLSIVDLGKNGVQFLTLLADLHRFEALPAISGLYETLRASYEKTLEASVVVCEPLTDDEKNKLTAALKERFKCEVNMTVQMDKSLLGGMIVRTGDWVIDGSLHTQLRRLREEITS